MKKTPRHSSFLLITLFPPTILLLNLSYANWDICTSARCDMLKICFLLHYSFPHKSGMCHESYDTSLVAFSSFLFSTRCFPLWWYLYSPFPKCPKANAFSERECSERVHWISSWTSSHFGANAFGTRFDVRMSLSCTVIRCILDSYVLFFFFRFARFTDYTEKLII